MEREKDGINEKTTQVPDLVFTEAKPSYKKPVMARPTLYKFQQERVPPSHPHNTVPHRQEWYMYQNLTIIRQNWLIPENNCLQVYKAYYWSAVNQRKYGINKLQSNFNGSPLGPWKSVLDMGSSSQWHQVRRQMKIIKGWLFDLLLSNGMLNVLIRLARMRRF